VEDAGRQSSQQALKNTNRSRKEGKEGCSSSWKNIRMYSTICRQPIHKQIRVQNRFVHIAVDFTLYHGIKKIIWNGHGYRQSHWVRLTVTVFCSVYSGRVLEYFREVGASVAIP
jgi:hypothetical protein